MNLLHDTGACCRVRSCEWCSPIVDRVWQINPRIMNHPLTYDHWIQVPENMYVLAWQNIFVMRCCYLLESSSPVVFSTHSWESHDKELLPHITHRKCHCNRKQELGWSNNEQCPSSGARWGWLESSVRWDDGDKMKMTVQQQTTKQVTWHNHRSLNTVLVCRCNLLSEILKYL